MGRLFGTDGVRGVANKELTPELAFNLGKAGTYVLKAKTRDRLWLSEKIRESPGICWRALLRQVYWLWEETSSSWE